MHTGGTDSHGSHVVLRQQRNLQHLGVGLHGLLACSGDGLSGDAVNLVEGVRSQKSVICRANEELEC